MVLRALDGRLSFDNIMLDDGTLILPGTMLAVDGTPLFQFIDHTIPNYVLSSTLKSKAALNTPISYIITLECTNKGDAGKELIIDINIPAGFTYISSISNEGSYDSGTGKWTCRLNDMKAELNLTLNPASAGSQTQTSTLEVWGTSLETTCTILATDGDGVISKHEPITIPSSVLANMVDGRIYTVISYLKVHDTAGVHDGIKNNCLGVENGDLILGNRVVTADTITKLTCTFTYDEDEDLIIHRYDNYTGTSQTWEDTWYGLCLKEGFDTIYSESENLLVNPVALYDDNASSDLVIAEDSDSNEYIYKTSLITKPAGVNPFITGMELTLNSFGSSDSGVEAWLVDFKGNKSEIKSAFISQTGKIIFGEMADLWDLKSENILDKSLEIHLKFKNNTLSEETFSYNNLKIRLYYDEDITGGLGFTYNGIHSRNYQIKMADTTDNAGPEFNNTDLSMDKMDGVLPISQTIDKKSIEIEFNITGESIADAKNKVNTIARWLGNPRNSFDIVEEKPLIFDYNPNIQYMAKLSGSIENDINQDALYPRVIHCKAKFEVPSGVALSTTPSRPGALGKNKGIKKVKPVISVLAEGSNSIVITEMVNNTVLTLNQSVSANTKLFFDCENRTIKDNEGNIYNNPTPNSIWPYILPLSSFNFNVTGAKLRYIEFYESY